MSDNQAYKGLADGNDHGYEGYLEVISAKRLRDQWGRLALVMHAIVSTKSRRTHTLSCVRQLDGEAEIGRWNVEMWHRSCCLSGVDVRSLAGRRLDAGGERGRYYGGGT